MDKPQIAERIEAFVRQTFKVAPDDPHFGRDVDVFEGGYVDSIGLTELLAFIEDEFGTAVPDEELASDEFMTIDGMADILVRLADGG
jgi:acyl carrier protein